MNFILDWGPLLIVMLFVVVMGAAIIDDEIKKAHRHRKKTH